MLNFSHVDPKVLEAGVSHEDPKRFLLPMSTPAPASIKVSVEGNVTQAVYDPQQENSCVLLSFCRINCLSHRLGICSSAVAIELHTRKYFSCTMKLKVIDKISEKQCFSWS